MTKYKRCLSSSVLSSSRGASGSFEIMSRPFVVVLEALMSLLQLMFLWSDVADAAVSGKVDMGYSMPHTWWCDK
jgi:hypothetical protein